MLDKIQEYDPLETSTWTPMAMPCSQDELERANRELVAIAGLTNGHPNLIFRWGATHRAWLDGSQKLKYWLANTEPTCRGYYYNDEQTGEMVKIGQGDLMSAPPTAVVLPLYEADELGERRFIVEQYRSPEFLTRAGRNDYDNLHDNVPGLLICFDCHTPKPERGKPCPECRSMREDVTKGDGHQMLKEVDASGDYDFFLRLEGRNLKCLRCETGICDNLSHTTYRPIAQAYLDAIASLWHYQQNASTEQKRDDNEEAAQRTARLMREADNAIWSQDNVMRQRDLSQAENRRAPMVSVL